MEGGQDPDGRIRPTSCIHFFDDAHQHKIIHSPRHEADVDVDVEIELFP